MTKVHPKRIRPLKAREVRLPLSNPCQPASDVISEWLFVSAAVLTSAPPRPFLAGFRQAIASLALLGVTLSALGQSDLQGNPPRLNTAPPDSSLTVSNRAAKRDAYKAAITALRSDQKSPAVMVELAIELARDKDLEIRQMAIGALLSVEPYISPTERASWGKLCGKLFRPMLDDIGLEARPGEPEMIPQFRASLLGPLGLAAADPEVLAHFRRIATRQISSTNRWGPEMYGPLFITTVHGDAAWAKQVQKAYENSNTPDLRARLSHFLISFRDPALLRAGLDYALTNVVDSREFMTLLLAGVLKETAAVRFEWLKENFELVSKRLDPKTLEVVAIDMISAGDARLFAEGELFLLDPKRRTPVYERVLEARKKELAPLFAKRDKYREGLARALDKGLKGNLHETSPSLRNP